MLVTTPMSATWFTAVRDQLLDVGRMFAAPPAPPAAYPNRLLEPRPLRDPLPRAGLVLVALFLLCLLPRLLMIPRVEVICSDGVGYIGMAEAIERGDYAYAFRLQLNLYPVILVAMHQLGFSYELGGKLWGVLASSLVVLPLFGWVRRQFDDRVAIVAALIYALHPELIEWSPELVRESTFWLAMTVTIYALWRAVVEVRWRYFAWGSVALVASCLTRFEGVFLVVPFVAWSWMRWRALHEGRARLAIGALAAPLTLTLLLLLASLVSPHPRVSWNVMQTAQVERVARWVQSFTAAEPRGPVINHLAAQGGGAAEPLRSWPQRVDKIVRQAWHFGHTLERGLSAQYAIVLLLSYLAWHKLLNRRDHLPLTMVVALIMMGIWVHLWYTGLASSRYCTAIILLTARCAALGLIDFGAWLDRLWLRSGAPRLHIGVAGCLTVLATIGCVDAWTTQFESRQISANVGHWLRDTFGEQRVILGLEEQLAIISYHAHAHYCVVPQGISGEGVIDFVRAHPTDLILISRAEPRAADFDLLLTRYPELGYASIDPQQIPDKPGRLVLLARMALAQTFLDKPPRALR